MSAGMPNNPLGILFVSDALIAVDKPAGMIVHGDGTGTLTLTDALREAILAGAIGRCDKTDPNELQALQRLDRDTTGIVLFSRRKSTQPLYDRLIAEHGFEKRVSRRRTRSRTLDGANDRCAYWPRSPRCPSHARKPHR